MSDTEPDRANGPACCRVHRRRSVSSTARGAALFIDPAAQIHALAELMDDGLLTREEFDRAKQRALRWSNDG